jgi:hypothetical protein
MAGPPGNYSSISPFSAQSFAFPGLAPQTQMAPMPFGSEAMSGATNPALMPSNTPMIPGMPTMPGTLPGMGSGFGFNVPTAQLALSGLGTLGSLWGAFQSAKMAKKQFGYTKDVTESNLANQIKSYNTALEDRIRSRSKVEGMSTEQAQSYLDRNRLNRDPTKKKN